MCLAVPGKIISINNADPLFLLGEVDFGGVRREVNLSCVPEAQIGDYVIVHVGMALSVLQEDEALKIREDMRHIVENSAPIESND
ncbi:MAG: HypC/HybG/HupF family hydrogenase formation chaperone [Akkermansia sp.]|nr:HypC/HybG/HupF family hydrogenase formation chaperone [Akkermansia sp.]